MSRETKGRLISILGLYMDEQGQIKKFNPSGGDEQNVTDEFLQLVIHFVKQSDEPSIMEGYSYENRIKIMEDTHIKIALQLNG
jgi:hypothetical protein